MTLALASRGYLCLGRKLISTIFGPGPGIVSSELLSPDITGAAKSLEDTPEILGAGVKEPSATATVVSVPPTPDSPQIVGGDVLTPDIRK